LNSGKKSAKSAGSLQVNGASQMKAKLLQCPKRAKNNGVSFLFLRPCWPLRSGSGFRIRIRSGPMAPNPDPIPVRIHIPHTVHMLESACVHMRIQIGSCSDPDSNESADPDFESGSALAHWHQMTQNPNSMSNRIHILNML
jgi:hypothetical protein